MVIKKKIIYIDKEETYQEIVKLSPDEELTIDMFTKNITRNTRIRLRNNKLINVKIDKKNNKEYIKKCILYDLYNAGDGTIYSIRNGLVDKFKINVTLPTLRNYLFDLLDKQTIYSYHVVHSNTKPYRFFGILSEKINELLD